MNNKTGKLKLKEASSGKSIQAREDTNNNTNNNTNGLTQQQIKDILKLRQRKQALEGEKNNP